MRNQEIRKIILCMLSAVLLLSVLKVSGEAGVSSERNASGLIEDVLSFQLQKTGAGSLQSWVDGSLAETAEGSGGWYLIALCQNGKEFDDARCRQKLQDSASEEIRSITVRLRMALTMTALGMDSSFPMETMEALAEERTLMPLVFGLHLLNNGISAASVTSEEVVRRLLDLQLEDGGWAVIGKTCDVDCTAMVLQALAPLADSDEGIRTSAERGLGALSAIQLDNGGFTGLGMESSESCSQVLLALSCLGIDCERDERFLKNGSSVLDALLRFRLGDGAFSHTSGKGFNETATVQAFYALVGYLRMLRGEGPYYVFDRQESDGKPVSADAAAATDGKAGENGGGETDRAFRPESAETGFSRIPLYAGIVFLGLLASVVSRVRGRKNWRTYAFIAGITVLLVLGVSRVRIESPERYYAGGSRTGTEIRTVISIRCDPVAGMNEYAPADGVILAETEIGIPEKGSAFDQLAEATRTYRIQMEYDGTSAGAYVRGIAYLYEYDFGNLSGWMYRVNGTFADVGATQYTLKEGDRVEWIYSTNIGKDIDMPGSF